MWIDTFSGSFFDTESTSYDASHSLLTDVESQSIADFFSNTDPFLLAESHVYPPPNDVKDNFDNYNNWSSFITPATVHGVSTTIPDQAHLHNGFFNDHNSYAQPSLPLHHLGNTRDDLQAAETLFHNSQSAYANNRSRSFHDQPSSSRPPPPKPEPALPALDQNGKAMIITPHGLINEQLAALIPNHAEEGTLDAQFAAQWVGTNAMQIHEAEIERPNLKRSYTFGTDDTFNNPAGFSAYGQGSTDQSTRRMTGADGNGNGALPDDQSDDEQSENASSDEEEDQKPAKKRRQSKAGKDSTRKGARNGKSRKAVAAEESSKKRRAAAQKLQRENLTEEQKRSNHILSEQKRRNLIKRGFDDLHDLVPEIRNGGLSKSAILTEAANFLEKVIEDNIAFKQQLPCG
jgi:flagellar biosynthesis GTPase FlhF